MVVFLFFVDYNYSRVNLINKNMEDNYMENKNIVLLRHHPMNVKFTNAFYTNQLPNIEDYILIDVSSRVVRNKEFMKEHPTFCKDLSPLIMGPITSNDGVVAHTLEQLYQCSKVYPGQFDQNGNLVVKFVDDNGDPTPEYFKWRNEMFTKVKVSKREARHPNLLLNCKHSDTLYFLHYNMDKGTYEKLNFIESRKKFYVPTYAKYVVKTDSYKWLKSLVDSGKKIALVDFDAFNYYSDEAKTRIYNSYINKCKKNGWTPKYTLNDYLSITNMNQFYDSSFISTGHASVLKMLLEADIEVVNDKIVDHIGVLK